MHAIAKEIQSKFKPFDLLRMPIALFSGVKKELIFRNNSFDELYNASGTVTTDAPTKSWKRNCSMN